MPFTATLTGARQGLDPRSVKITVLYADSETDWHHETTLTFQFDPAQTIADQRAALRALVVQDARRYLRQLRVFAGLRELIGTEIEITPPDPPPP